MNPNYPLDSHPVARLAVGGFSRWEGGAISGTPPYPFGISYRSIIPGTNQCQNLFCTFALSASHVGFAPVRMEPVFMMTSQSAATAAAFAIDDNVPVQQLNYQKLSAQLRADGQVLTWPAANGNTNGIILDQGGPGTTYSTYPNGWSAGANAGGWNGDYWHDGNNGKGNKWISYTPTLPTNGTYEVDAWWVSNPNRANNTPYYIVHAAGATRVPVNQQNSSGGWFKLLTTNFNAGIGSSVTISNLGTTGYVIADGVRWLPVGSIAPPQPPPAVDLVASDAVACEFGTNTARFGIVRSGDTNLLPLTLNYTVGGTAVGGVDYAALPGSITIPAGALATNIVVTPLGSSLATNQATVTLTLVPSSNFTSTSLSNATIVILDRPINMWRRANFTPAELADPSISGDLADPDHDGLSNLMEYALGLPPKDPTTVNRPYASITNGYLTLTYTCAKAATDVSLVVEQSNDLLTWQSGSNQLRQISLVEQGTTQLIADQLGCPQLPALACGPLALRGKAIAAPWRQGGWG